MANTVDKVINIALAEVGYLEKKSNSQLYNKTANAGSANYTKYGKEMHDIYPSVMDYPAAWCDAFVDWCFYKAYGVSNAKGLLGGNFNDYTPSSANLYKIKSAWHTSNPKVGDQIFFKNSTRICHTGLVYKVDNTYVYTIEGNTSGASGVIANGGGVCKKKYALNYSLIAGYGRPKYDTTYLMKGDKGSEVKTLQENLNCLGYSCGTVDGDFGTKTDVALRKFQSDYKLTVDGKYGETSKKTLEDAVAKKKTSTSSSNNSISISGGKYVFNGIDYALVFNPTYYSNKYADLKSAFGTNASKLFEHFVNFGMKEKRQAIESFNVTVYKNRYTDLQKAFGDDLPSYYKHYVEFGKKEGRSAV